MSMYDATCPKCRCRFGWSGEYSDRPPCPRCGRQISAEALASDQAAIDALRAILVDHGIDTPGSVRRGQRLAAGLTQSMAARLLEIGVVTLMKIELGHLRPGAKLGDRMRTVYGLERAPTPPPRIP